MDSLIVYTANFGNKDKIYQESFVKENIEYVYFTDRKVECNDRNVIVEPSRYADPVKAAKWYKLHPHVLFPGKTTFWLDANYGVSKKKNIFELLSQFNHIMLELHAKQPYDEVTACIAANKVAELDKFKVQVEHYKKEGLPLIAGYYRGGILLRKPTELITRFNQLWWDEIERWQMRDQISLSYVLWKHKIPVVPFTKGYYGRRGNHVWNPK